MACPVPPSVPIDRITYKITSLEVTSSRGQPNRLILKFLSFLILKHCVAKTCSTSEVSKIQIIELDRNCNKFDIPQFDINSEKQGIVHVVGPENGFTLPGLVK